MKVLRRLLLIPALAPLLAVLVLSAANRDNSARLQLLIWRSPELPLAAWTALAAVAGASISGFAALVLLPARRPLQRTTHQTVEPFLDDPPPPPVDPVPPMPERDLRDPAPTVAVPYRVVQRPSASRSGSTAAPPPPAAAPAPATSGQQDDWGLDPDRNW